MNKHFCFASVVSEIKQSDMFMTVKARIFETPKANLNGVRVTSAFLNEIVENEDRYVGLPLYADVRALKNGNYNRLGHLYDTRTGEFHSTQIGSFYQFEKEEYDEGSYLIGYARIPKRDKKISKAIAELFADGNLKFSFEISVGDYEEQEDGTTLIDASENNYLEGTAIVTFPACEDAVALEFVAQRQADDSERGETEMAEVETKAEVIETEAEAVETKVAETEETACKDKEKSEEEATSEENKETAAVVVHERHEETQSVYAYDTESGADVSQRVTVETTVSHVEPEAQIVEDFDGVKIAEEGDEAIAEDQNGNDNSGGSEPKDAAEQEANDEPAAEDLPVVEDSKKKTAEQMIAELAEAVSKLTAEIETLKESKQTLTKSAVTAELNPFIGDIRAEKKYSLLEEVETVNNFSLLEKA